MNLVTPRALGQAGQVEPGGGVFVANEEDGEDTHEGEEDAEGDEVGVVLEADVGEAGEGTGGPGGCRGGRGSG